MSAVVQPRAETVVVEVEGASRTVTLNRPANRSDFVAESLSHQTDEHRVAPEPFPSRGGLRWTLP